MRTFGKSFVVAFILLALGIFMTSGIAAAEMKKVAISTIVEVPALTQSRDGIIAALKERGYVEGENLEIDYQNANGNMPTQQQIAKKFVGSKPDVIVAITTPTAQAMVSATKTIPIVFTTVTDPIKAKLIDSYEKPGKNVTGVSDMAPLQEQLKLFRMILPDLKKMGFIYNPGLDNALATLGWLEEFAKPMGITIVKSPSPTTNEVQIATRKLIGKVDAIYVPNDTTIVSALESVIKVCQDTNTPVFVGDPNSVKRGAIASVGLDYIAIGKIAGNMAADILEGKNPGDIDAVLAYKVLTDFPILVGTKSAEMMGVELSPEVLKAATKVIDNISSFKDKDH